MKQGTASSSGPGARKREPIPHAVSPAGVSQIGSAMGNHATDSTKILSGGVEPMYQGRGFEAPIAKSVTIHHGGSQGRR